MSLIHVPKPSKSARNPNRPVSSLLRMQIEHLHEAEKRLPLRYRTAIYVNAIKTEGDAARYIRETTEAIHAAHEAAARARRASGRKRERELTVANERRPARKRATKMKKKVSSIKPGRKK